jgi:hypothetical protein
MPGSPGWAGGMWPYATRILSATVIHGLRSRLAQTVNASRPPDRSTRRVSANAIAGFGISM